MAGRSLSLGASKGGKARTASMTAQERSNLARQAAVARWMKEGKEPPVFAEYGSPDRPLRIGPIEIPCYVLMDGRRVLSQRGLQGGIGLSEAGGPRGARRLTVLMASLAEKGLSTADLIALKHFADSVHPATWWKSGRRLRSYHSTRHLRSHY